MAMRILLQALGLVLVSGCWLLVRVKRLAFACVSRGRHRLLAVLVRLLGRRLAESSLYGDGTGLPSVCLLEHAAAHGDAKMVQVILSRHRRAGDGGHRCHPLYSVRGPGSDQKLRDLLDHGWRLDDVRDGCTPLFLAIGRAAAIRRLGSDSQTAFEMVRLMLEAGAGVDDRSQALAEFCGADLEGLVEHKGLRPERH